MQHHRLFPHDFKGFLHSPWVCRLRRLVSSDTFDVLLIGIFHIYLNIICHQFVSKHPPCVFTVNACYTCLNRSFVYISCPFQRIYYFSYDHVWYSTLGLSQSALEWVQARDEYVGAKLRIVICRKAFSLHGIEEYVVRNITRIYRISVQIAFHSMQMPLICSPKKCNWSMRLNLNRGSIGDIELEKEYLSTNLLFPLPRKMRNA